VAVASRPSAPETRIDSPPRESGLFVRTSAHHEPENRMVVVEDVFEEPEPDQASHLMLLSPELALGLAAALIAHARAIIVARDA
jgi:hypothetical protein